MPSLRRFGFVTSRMIIFIIINYSEASSIYSHVGDDVQFSWTLNPVPNVNYIIYIQNPNDYVMFFVSGTEVGAIHSPYTGRIVYNGNTATGHMRFTLKQITRLDAGVYTASKAGAAGSLVYQGPTLFVLEASSIYSCVEDDVQFSWTLNPVPIVNDVINIQNPKGKVMFYVFGTEAALIEYPYTGRIVYNGSTTTGLMSFTLKHITTLDAGVYTASKAGAAGSPVYQGPTLFVLGKPTKPFVTELSPPVVNKNLHLNCSTSSTTVPGNHNLSMTYIWNIDAVNITSSTGRYLVLDSSISIENIKTKDKNKIITCTGTEQGGLTSDISNNYILLDHLYGPLTVTFTPSTTSYSITEQGTIPDIICTADCKPNCSCIWTKDGQVTSRGSGSTLSLSNINRNDTGVYRCTAWNVYGTKNSSNINVDVKYGPGTVIFSSLSTNYSLTENATIPDITCTADCKPNCSYRWTKNGQVTSHGSGSILSLRNVNRNDTGVYRCTAWNDYGTKNTSDIYVDVKYVDINPGASKLTFETTEDIQLTCSVRGNYGGVVFRSWTQQIGSRLIRMFKGFSTDDETVVKIPYSSYQDVGNYTCYVYDRNGIFLKSRDVEVTVNDKPVITETIKIQEQKGNVEIIVEFYSVPKPFKVDWIKEGAVVSLSEKYRQSNTIVQITLTLHEVRVQLTGYRAKLTITNVTDHDIGTYVLRIENFKGISTQQVNYQRKNQQKEEKEETNALNSTVIVIVIGVSVTVAVTVTIVIVICFARRRRANKNENESVKMNEKIESKYEELQVRTAQQPYDVPETEVLKKINMNVVGDKDQNGQSQTQEDKAEYEEIQEQVLQLPSDPVITGYIGIVLYSGSTITLTCTVQGEIPLATLFWTCGGSSITGIVKNSTTASISEVTLNIDSSYNGQKCVCKAQHLLWTTGKTAESQTFVVYYTPIITLDTTSITVQEGDNPSGRPCSAIGNPTPTVKWYRGSSEQTSGTGTSATLVFSNIDRNQADTYQCKAAATGQ